MHRQVISESAILISTRHLVFRVENLSTRPISNDSKQARVMGDSEHRISEPSDASPVGFVQPQ